MPVNEVNMIYEMNREARITINTPIGSTKEISVKEIVKQGSIYGPVLCGISTDKINKIGKYVAIKYENQVDIEPMIYVDDIIAVGNKETIEETIRNCRELEIRKKMTFNNEKSNYQILKFSNQKAEEIKEKVKKGTISRTKTYKYLGDIINEAGNYKEAIQSRSNKQNYIITMLKDHATKSGPMYTQVIQKLFDAIVIPILTYNTETWSNITKEETEKIEKIQKNILLKIYQMPQSTPYNAFLSEVGIWPIQIYIKYKKLLFLHQLLKSEKERFARIILIEQQKNSIPKCWYSEIKVLSNQLQVNVDFEEVMNYTKNEWKKYINKAINKRISKELEETGTKGRFMDGTNRRKRYIDSGNVKTTTGIMRIRLNMVEVKCNYKGKYKGNLTCPMCKIENDTTEHLFDCKKLKEVIRCDRKIDSEDIKNDNISKLTELEEYAEKAMKIRDIYMSKI
jgi:hypothetical protein